MVMKDHVKILHRLQALPLNPNLGLSGNVVLCVGSAFQRRRREESKIMHGRLVVYGENSKYQCIFRARAHTNTKTRTISNLF